MKITILSIVLLFSYVIAPVASADIVINEVELNPSSPEPFDIVVQWVELYNDGTEDVDISGYIVYPIIDRTKKIEIEDNTIIGPKGFIVISSSDWLSNRGDLVSWLNYNGDSVVLEDIYGQIIDRTPFIRDINGDDCAWSRYPDGGPEWSFMISSPGGPASGQLCEENEVEYVRFSMDQSVHGIGFTNSIGSISGQGGKRFNSQEHGSGNYSSENTLGYYSDVQTINQYIRLGKKNSLDYDETVFLIANAQPINFNSRWTSVLRSEGSQSSARMQVSHQYAITVKGTTQIVIGIGGSRMAVDSEFKGAAEVKYDSPKLRSVEDYTGSFRVSENFSESYFNKSAFSIEDFHSVIVEKRIEDMVRNKSALSSSTAGYGFVRVEKQIGKNLKTYERGTGAYMSEEEIRTDTDTESMAKDITLIHRPVSYSYSPQRSINRSIKWREGIYSKDFSKDKGISLISEDFSDISRLEKETIANGSRAINSQASFTGKASLRTDIRGPLGEVYQDGEYYGSYNIDRRATRLPMYEKPHFSITKQGRVSSEKCNVLDYSIVVLNDGNIALGPIYVKDTFPSGTQLMDTNLMPLDLTSRSANWSICELGIGESFTIEAKLKVIKSTNSTINRVKATTYYEYVTSGTAQMRRLSASNTSTINLTWDECKPTSLSVSMSATTDKSNPNLVRYRLDIKNIDKQNMRVNATVTLPPGMKFINSTTKPISISDNEISWSISRLLSGRRNAISFIGDIEDNAFFVSTAQVYGYSTEGEELASEAISIPVLIGKYVEFVKVNASEWLPCSNDSQFRSIDYNSETMCCDLW